LVIQDTGATGPGGAPCGDPAAGFRHEALVYSSADELTEVAASFLREGLDAGDVAVIAVGRDTTGPLREALGGDPRVMVLERGSLYRPRTPSAITTFRRLAAEQAPPGQRVRVVGEVDFGATAADRQEWQRYESVINEAFAPLPLWGLCVFDATRSPSAVLDIARQTHPYLRTSAGSVPNPEHVDPAEYLTALPVPDEPLERTSPLLADDDVLDPIGLRQALRGRLAAVDGPADVVEDFLLAVDEMVSNAVRHGRPPVGVRLWAAVGTLVCTVRDAGRGWDAPFAGYGPAHGDDLAAGGMGLWLARQLCDHVAIRRDEQGVGVRLTSRWS
jgi:anti-sigma regulatory factor (Ser/Thr protein kinase)